MSQQEQMSMGPINIVTNKLGHMHSNEATQRTMDTNLGKRVSSANRVQEKARVIDLNNEVSFPANQGRKKNKNDFYRFLLE